MSFVASISGLMVVQVHREGEDPRSSDPGPESEP